MARVFISYRQNDAKGWAAALKDELCRDFDEDEIFVDKDTIRAGDWRAQIDAELAGCEVFLPVIGPHWSIAADQAGGRRLLRDDDVLRHEIATALGRPAIHVIPILVDDVVWPPAEPLPADLGTLLARQPRRLSDAQNNRRVDYRALRRDLRQLTGIGRAARRRRRWAWVGAACAAGLALLIAAIVLPPRVEALTPDRVDFRTYAGPDIDAAGRMIANVALTVPLDYVARDWMGRAITLESEEARVTVSSGSLKFEREAYVDQSEENRHDKWLGVQEAATRISGRHLRHETLFVRKDSVWHKFVDALAETKAMEVIVTATLSSGGVVEIRCVPDLVQHRRSVIEHERRTGSPRIFSTTIPCVKGA